MGTTPAGPQTSHCPAVPPPRRPTAPPPVAPTTPTPPNRYEKLLSQFMEVNNDYNEKQHYNKQLLKEREQFKQQLNAKDQMFKDDTKQRFQLRYGVRKVYVGCAQGVYKLRAGCAQAVRKLRAGARVRLARFLAVHTRLVVCVHRVTLRTLSQLIRKLIAEPTHPAAHHHRPRPHHSTPTAPPLNTHHPTTPPPHRPTFSQKMQKLLAENAQLKKHLGEKDLKLTTIQEQFDQIRSVIPSV